MIRVKKRYLLLSLALVGLLAVGGTLSLPTRGAQISRENYHRLDKGMTKAEVEAILGAPGDYTEWPHLGIEYPRWKSNYELCVWQSENGRLTVFYLDDKVFKLYFYPSESEPGNNRRQRFLRWLRNLPDQLRSQPEAPGPSSF